MNRESIHSELIQRRQKLQEVSLELKNRFLGLDNIIDELIALIMPWFLFPEAQNRPTVVNLWGLTGSGKTAMVQSLVELLNYRSLYTHFDMGEFDSSSASWMRSTLTDDLQFFDGKPAMICMDEFQFAKTVEANGVEISKDKLRVVWELIDSGKIEYIPYSNKYYQSRAENGVRRIERLVAADMTITDGVVAGDDELFKHIMDGYYMENQNCTISFGYFMSDDFIDGIYYMFEDEDLTKKAIREMVKKSSLEDIKALLMKGLRVKPATKTLDLSRSLIFILGNLDEAYWMSKSMNPDINADEFYEQTSKITIADIKRALRKRFRAEQIARLGNNHIIYTSFNNAQFRLLIRRELDRVAKFVVERFGWAMSFDESVVNVVYAEGVFPTQGTRPVLTTVKNLIESRISKLVVMLLEYQLTVKEVSWSYADSVFTYTIKDADGNVVSVIPDVVKLKLENLRKSVDPQLQAHTAVHEAGHAVLAALTLRIIPAMVVSKTAADAEGFCQVNFPKGPMTRKSLRADIILTLGGLVAEKMIFGEEFQSSGVHADLEEASALANKAVRKYGMGSVPIHVTVPNSQNDAFYDWRRYSDEALALIRDCETEATAILQRNKLLLLKIADHLTTNSKMEELQIEEFVRQYASDDWVRNEGFVKKEDYYKFDIIVQDQLKELEDQEMESIMEQLFSPEVTRII